MAWSVPKMTVMAKAGPQGCREPGAPAGLPTSVSRGPTAPVPQQGVGREAEQLGVHVPAPGLLCGSRQLCHHWSPSLADLGVTGRGGHPFTQGGHQPLSLDTGFRVMPVQLAAVMLQNFKTLKSI